MQLLELSGVECEGGDSEEMEMSIAETFVSMMMEVSPWHLCLEYENCDKNGTHTLTF